MAVKIKTVFFGHSVEGVEAPKATFPQFIKFFTNLPCFQFDVETTPENDFPKRILRTMQFGYQQFADHGSTIFRVVVQASWLKPEEFKMIKDLLENHNQPKLIHNATFEYEMMRKSGIILGNVIDTMNYEKIILSGKSGKGMYALDDLAMKYLYLKMDKSYQTAFAEDILTLGHIDYAAQDVTWLQAIARMQKDSIDLLGSANVAGLENGAVLGVGEMQYNGMGMDINYWLTMAASNEPIRDQAKAKINEMLLEEPFYSHCLKEKLLIEYDSVTINWNSPAQRSLVLKYLYPDLTGATKPIVTKYNKDKDDPYLRMYLVGDFSDINEMLLTAHKDWLLTNGLMHEAGTVLLNWGSPAQVLKLFQTVSPRLKSVEEEALGKVRHKVVKQYLKFKETEKLISTYGAGFIDKHLHSDGKVRTRYNQVVSTGRFSSSGPRMLGHCTVMCS
jgi:DNA polymerase I-like protein with 3'-5' exonuclease and polymerase domains